MVLKVLPLGLLVACAHTSSPVEKPAIGALTVAVVVDTDAQTVDAPAPLARDLAGVLGELGFNVSIANGELLGKNRSSAGRLRTLARRSQTAHLTLIELKPRYLNPSAGRFRWQVEAKISMASARTPERTTTTQITLPAILERINQGSPEALGAALPGLRRALVPTTERYVNALSTADSAARARILYLALVDRFADGPDAPRDDERPGDPNGWHGGDLDGLRAHLDAIAGLGVTDLWLTPLAPGRSEPFGKNGAFHGYWVYAADGVAERFGGMAAARRLRRALQHRGMGLMLDLVTNHVAWDAPLRDQHPDWFNPDRAITDWQSPEQVQRGWVHGLPDLNQRLPAVRRHLIERVKSLVGALRPEAVRIDAMRHQNPSFLRQLIAALGPVATAGEVYDGRPDVIAETQNRTGASHIFDFPMYYAMTDVFCDDKPMAQLAVVLSDDRLYNDPNRLITFLDNHDTPRLASRCKGDPERIAQALGFLTALRGWPMITYGTERGLSGADEPANRADMNFERHPTFKVLRTLIRRRQQRPALARGSTDIIDWSAGHIALLRHHRGDTQLVLSWRGAAPKLVDILPTGFVAAGAATGPRGTAVFPVEVSTERFAVWRTAHRALRKVVVTSSEIDLVITGSGQELHHWRAAQAAPIGREGLTISVPGGLVLAYKLARQADGQTTYEKGANRILSTLPAGDRSIDLTWRP
jgi:glycosidase